MWIYSYRQVTAADDSLFAGPELPATEPVYYCGCNEATVDDEETCEVTEVHDDCIDTVSLFLFNLIDAVNESLMFGDQIYLYLWLIG